jgi:hypothetical protein
MADRKIHYEAAFENLLRDKGIPYVAVDEAKRALFSDAKLKSFDYVVYSQSRPNLLVDIKGRRHQGPRASSFQTWSTQRDVEDLKQWESVFGDGFQAVLVFVYWLDAPQGDDSHLLLEEGVWTYKSRYYRMFGVDLHHYQDRMRMRSAKWETVAIGQEDFRTLARPIELWLS